MKKALFGSRILLAAVTLAPTLARADHLFAYCYDSIPGHDAATTTYVYSKVFSYEGSYESMQDDNNRYRPRFDEYVVKTYANGVKTTPACHMNISDEEGAKASIDEEVKTYRRGMKIVFSDWVPN